MNRWTAVVWVACVGWLSGCNSYEARLPVTGATLEGSITYNGEKIPLALINVLGEKGQATGQIDEPGLYKVDNVPLGPVKVGVNTEAMKGQMISQQMAASYKGPGTRGGARPAPPRFVSLPAKLQDPETSGIMTTIRKGKNTLDIALPAGK